MLHSIHQLNTDCNILKMKLFHLWLETKELKHRSQEDSCCRNEHCQYVYMEIHPRAGDVSLKSWMNGVTTGWHCHPQNHFTTMAKLGNPVDLTTEFHHGYLSVSEFRISVISPQRMPLFDQGKHTAQCLLPTFPIHKQPTSPSGRMPCQGFLFWAIIHLY